MPNPANGEERRENLLGILGGDLRQWWVKLDVLEKATRIGISLVVLAFGAGMWWFSIQSAYGPLPAQVENNHETIREVQVQVQGLDGDMSELERDLTRIDLRQDSIVGVVRRIEGTVIDTRCWARVSAGVDDPSQCIQ